MQLILRTYCRLIVIAGAALAAACSNWAATTSVPNVAGIPASLTVPAVNVQYAALDYQN